MGVLESKVAIVTGAGGGIGRGITHAFAKEGARVVVVDRNPTTAQGTAAELQKLGPEALPIHVDVSSYPQVRGMVEAAVQRFGTVNILVNVAQSWTGGSRGHLGAPIEEIPEEWWDESFNTGVKATWYCCKAVLPYMKNGGGKIINFGSLTGILGWERMAEYNANKEAIRGFSRTAAREWGKYKINVNVICPSALSAANAKGAALAGASDSDLEAARAIQAWVSQLPIQRVGKPEEDMGRVAVFLASEASDYITGQTFMVDGGAHML